MQKLNDHPEPGSPGTLNIGEPHPSSPAAFAYVKAQILKNPLLIESISSVGLSDDNRLAEICGHTLARIINGQPISDRYLLGLAWMIKSLEEHESNDN